MLSISTLNVILIRYIILHIKKIPNKDPNPNYSNPQTLILSIEPLIYYYQYTINTKSMQKDKKLLLESGSEGSDIEHPYNSIKTPVSSNKTTKQTCPSKIIEDEDSLSNIEDLIQQKEIEFKARDSRAIKERQDIQQKPHPDSKSDKKWVGKQLAADTFQSQTESLKHPLKPKQKNNNHKQTKEKSDEHPSRHFGTFTDRLSQYKYQAEDQKQADDCQKQADGCQKQTDDCHQRQPNVFRNKLDDCRKQLIRNQSSDPRKMIIINYQKIENQCEVELGNVPVFFPYKPYPLQIDYMRSIIEALEAKENALLESPTGTGKTLSLLCAVLSWVQNHALNSLKKTNSTKVIYLSRTHTQLKQVQKQLGKTCFRPTMANFGSRDQFCIKKQFGDFKGRDLMEACSKGVKLALKAKRKLQLDEENQGQMNEQLGSQESHACKFYKSEGQYWDLAERLYKNRIIDSEQIREDGEYYQFCPYYYPFQIQSKADVIFMPYNYILDVGLLPRYKSIIEESILIFDEAHNVPESACEGRSMTITSGIYDRIKVELAKLEEHPRMSAQLKQVAYQYETIIQRIKKVLDGYQQKIDGFIEKIFESKQNDNEYEMDSIQKIIKPIQMRYIFYSWFYSGILTQEVETLTDKQKKQVHFNTVRDLRHLVEQVNMLIEAIKETVDGIFQNLQKFMGFLLKVSDLLSVFEQDMPLEWWKEEINHFRLGIKINSKEKTLYEIKLVCLTPSLTFDEILKLKPRSIILTSGTLSPMDSWEKQLRLKFNVKCQNPHIIQQDQLHMATLCKTPFGNPMNFSYNDIRKNNTIFKQLVQSMTQLFNRIKNGVLVIFPSYRIIKSFKDELKYNRESLIEMKNAKELLFQEKGSDDYILSRFKEKALVKKGAALFCVCRGKISEGLDFSDELCRAVIFVGVPYPNIKDPIIKQKREYCDRLSKECKDTKVKGLTGDQWYNLNTMRAVNQGIGRVIRHIGDYGVIILLDARYEQIKLRNLLPKWSKTNSQSYNCFDDLEGNIGTFFEKMIKKFPREKPLVLENLEENTQTAKEKPIKNAFSFMMSNANKKYKKKIEEKRPSSRNKFTRKPGELDFL